MLSGSFSSKKIIIAEALITFERRDNSADASAPNITFFFLQSE